MLFVLRAFIVSSINCILDLRGGGRAGEEEEGKIKVEEEGKRRAETDQHLHLPSTRILTTQWRKSKHAHILRFSTR